MQYKKNDQATFLMSTFIKKRRSVPFQKSLFHLLIVFKNARYQSQVLKSSRTEHYSMVAPVRGKLLFMIATLIQAFLER